MTTHRIGTLAQIAVTLFFVLSMAHLACGQAADEPRVCISQAAANKCSSVAAELVEARKVIEEFQVERAVSLAERGKAATLIAGLNELVVVKDRVIAGYEQINALYKQTIELQQQIIESLEKRLMKPKSAFSKLMDALKAVSYILAGAALGRVVN